MVLTVSKAALPGQLSTMQISKGCKRHKETFLTIIHEVDDEKGTTIMKPLLKVVAQVLGEYKDVMSPEFPK